MHALFIRLNLFVFFAFCSLFAPWTAASETPLPAPVASTVEDTWNLKDLFVDQQAWHAAATSLTANMPRLLTFKGQLSRDARQLAQCLKLYFQLKKELARLTVYAQSRNNADGSDPVGQDLVGRATKLNSQLDETASFMAPEILAIPQGRLRKLQATKELVPYRFTLDNITRLRAHTLNAREAEIAAQSSEMAAVPAKTYTTFSTLNHPFAKVKLHNDEEVELTFAAYTHYRTLQDTADREKVFHEFFGSLQRTRETYASLLDGAILRDHFYAKLKKYDNDLAASLGESNVPTSVYYTMLEQVKANRQLLWRYLKLKQKMLALAELKYSDLYLPLSHEPSGHYTFAEAKKIAHAAISPLGADYVKILDRALAGRWIDVYPRKGKESGAYMDSAAYDVHPYILMNYSDDYESVSTFLHEFGHSAHSYLAISQQPYHTADYPIFVAEVASTFNEILLNRYLAKAAPDDKAKLFLLGAYLESWRTTVFRQAFFADFEQNIHRLAAEGKTLTADLLQETYLKLLREYYGEAEGIVKIDPLYAVEWAFIPHFYGNFYVFQYTTSFIAATALAQKVLGEEPGVREGYLNMLKAGGSRYPIDLLKIAGVDMSGPEVYGVAFKAMDKALTEAEQLTR